jgi:hypothetical protein
MLCLCQHVGRLQQCGPRGCGVDGIVLCIMSKRMTVVASKVGMYDSICSYNSGAYAPSNESYDT